MYAVNEQFAAATRQFADAAAQINRVALSNAQAVFGLQAAAIGERMDATFAFLNEAAQVRDFDAAKALWPKAAQVARENMERAVTTAQETMGRTLKTHESIADVAKSQFEAGAARAQDVVQQAQDAVQKAAKVK